MTFLRAAFPYLVSIASAVVLFIFVYQFGVHVEHQERVAEVALLKAGYSQKVAEAEAATADAQKAARDTEAQRVADMAALDAAHTEEMNNAKTVSDAAIAGVRAGTVRVRERFTCPRPAAASGGSAKAGTSTGLGDEGKAGGLSSDDVAILLRESQRADEVAVALKAAQDIIRSDRKGQ